MGRLVILSGPSCIGKGPLHQAMVKFYPHLMADLQKVVLYNDRAPRPGEQDGVDFHFRPRGMIESLAGTPGYLVVPVRSDLQALELAALERILQGGKTPFYEGNPYVLASLRQCGWLERLSVLSIFLSPLSSEEIGYFKSRDPGVDLALLVQDIQRRKLLQRTAKAKGHLSLPDLQEIERRSGNAWREMQEAVHFDWVIPLHDGEGNDNWDAHYYPIGAARRAMLAFAKLLQNEDPGTLAEKWLPDLLQ
ncbi:MAG: hypothetical protein HQL55_11000 [Magnetococcales bacterium]|nr:hypothetical protein [Magnetococcales bacterium]